MSTEYPEDEFDIAGRERAPQGVHRAPRSPLATVLPFIVVLVLVPLLAWATVSLLSRDDGAPEPSATGTAPASPTATATATDPAEPDGEATGDDGGEPEPTAEPTTEPAPEPTTEPAPEETEEPDAAVDYSASISVLNGAGINGLAGDAAGELMAAGFGNTIAADYGAAAPATTTLYYRNAELAPTAQAIGDLLGITELVELASATENVQIAIVLRSDYVR